MLEAGKRASSPWAAAERMQGNEAGSGEEKNAAAMAGLSGNRALFDRMAYGLRGGLYLTFFSVVAGAFRKGAEGVPRTVSGAGYLEGLVGRQRCRRGAGAGGFLHPSVAAGGRTKIQPASSAAGGVRGQAAGFRAVLGASAGEGLEHHAKLPEPVVDGGFPMLCRCLLLYGAVYDGAEGRAVRGRGNTKADYGEPGAGSHKGAGTQGAEF